MPVPRSMSPQWPLPQTQRWTSRLAVLLRRDQLLDLLRATLLRMGCRFDRSGSIAGREDALPLRLRLHIFGILVGMIAAPLPPKRRRDGLNEAGDWRGEECPQRPKIWAKASRKKSETTEWTPTACPNRR